MGKGRSLSLRWQALPLGRSPPPLWRDVVKLVRSQL